MQSTDTVGSCLSYTTSLSLVLSFSTPRFLYPALAAVQVVDDDMTHIDGERAWLWASAAGVRGRSAGTGLAPPPAVGHLKGTHQISLV